MKKRILALLLAVAVLAGMLAGCSKSNTNTPSGTDTNNPGTPGSTTTTQTSSKYAFKAEYLDLALENCDYISQMAVSADALYIIGSFSSNNGGNAEGDNDILYANDAAVPAAETEAAEAETAAADTQALTDELPAEKMVADAPIADMPATDDGVELPAEFETRLFKIDLATGEATHLDWYQEPTIPDGYEGWANVNLLRVSDDGTLWIGDSVSTYTFDLPANFDPNMQNQYDYYVDGPTEVCVYHYATDGTLLAEITVPQAESGDAMQLTSIDAQNRLYFSGYDGNATITDDTGKTIKTVTIDDGSLIDFCGKPAVQSWGDSGTSIQLFDSDTMELGEKIPMPYNAWTFHPSYNTAYDFYYENNSALYGYKLEEKVSEKVMDWIDCDVDPSNINNTMPLPDGRFLGLQQSYDDAAGANTYTAILLTPVDPATLPQKVVLTLACLYMDYDLRQQVIEFNKSNDNVRITINDYSQYVDENGTDSALTKLNTEIISGKVPDLFLTTNLPVEQYAAQGVLEDLLPMLESDPDLSYDQLMTNVVDAASINGKLYQAFSEFTINTVAVMPQISSQFNGSWTVQDVQSAMQQLQSDANIFGTGYTRSDVLSSCVGNALAKFVDWSTGKCSFDSQEFKDLLVFANQFPETFDWSNHDWSSDVDSYTAMRTGLQLMQPISVYTLDDYLWTLAALGGKVALTGYPSQDGTGSTFNLSSAVAISSSCADKDAAWQFVRTLFSADYQREREWYGLPSNAAVFNERLQNAMTVEYQDDGEGNQVVSPKAVYNANDGTTTTIDAMTQEQADQIMALYNSIHTLSGTNDAIYNIVTEEAGAYFAGQRSVDDVANIIQNRVGLYVAEQK